MKTLLEFNSVRHYLERIGAEVRSFKTAVVKEMRGEYWRDIAIIKFDASGKVSAPESFAPTEKEANEIEYDITNVDFPKHIPTQSTSQIPEEVKKIPDKDRFYFYNLNNEIEMIQVKAEYKGKKYYLPYTYWSDGEWRRMEPDGPLPLWGIDQLEHHTTVFIHEGAKAARHIREMVEAKTPKDKMRLAKHPWGEELSQAAHIGWIGGALSPSRTDWGMIAKCGVVRAYIVSDNDFAGVSAVPSISYQLHIPTFHVQFTDEWPASFDLADPWPKKLFKEIEGLSYYIGPPFKSCVHPATWATDKIEAEESKKSNIVLRENFKEMWSYCEEADLFICTEMPEIVRSESIFNNMLSSFSHVNNLSKLLLKAYRGRHTRLCYRPDEKGKLVTDGITSAINLHIPSYIKRSPGDSTPFLEFLAYLFPNPNEWAEALRWCATLIARPDIRMEYGLLLVSEAQGIGKTTLGASILAPLVGHHNTSFPSETAIVQSEFNEWMANKRLVVVNEIYSGRSWKAYQKLKSTITDKHVEVNQKYQRCYTIENWCHILACSNSLRALRMEEDDRRWFYPEVIEESWPRKEFVRLYNWLGAGGLSIIKNWAVEEFPNEYKYVLPGQRAPMTERKRELIAGSRTEAQTEAVALAEAINGEDRAIAMAMKDIVTWVRNNVQGKVFDTDYEIRKAMKDAGAIVYPRRIKVDGRLQYIIVNSHKQNREMIIKAKLNLVNKGKGQGEEIKKQIVSPEDIMRSNI